MKIKDKTNSRYVDEDKIDIDVRELIHEKKILSECPKCQNHRFYYRRTEGCTIFMGSVIYPFTETEIECKQCGFIIWRGVDA